MFSARHINLQSSEGFTLIELMIVMTILGVLAVVAVPNFMAYRDEAHIAATLSSGIREALAAAAVDNPENSYPTDDAISKPSDLNQYGANLQDHSFQTFTYQQLAAGGSYQVDIVTLGGKGTCVKPEGISKARCE